MNQQPQLIPMQTGDYLRQLRLERGLSLEKVAQTLKLNKQLLDDIEADRALSIARVYRDGYIRTYARYLGVPADKLESLLATGEQSSTRAVEPGVRNIFSPPSRRNTADRWLRATSYVLASLLIGTLAWQFTHEAVRLSQNGSQLQNPAEASAADTGDKPPQAFESTVEASIATLGALHDPQAADPAEKAWQAITSTPLAEGESSLQISVSADSWIEIVDATGQELEMDLLRGGSNEYYHGQPPFRILVGRASAVR
ncbi:MAG: DUF4115 domain-containing protein, partial [Xanthomonadales bacterium]|nr:DUF4115 domain-containing protein [Xanthomonadales bacterium]